MIEKVARAQAVVCSDCKKLGKVDWEAHLEDARAAIAAMREPTEEMLQNVAVTDINSKPVTMLDKYNRDKEYGKLTWCGMIDAALKE